MGWLTGAMLLLPPLVGGELDTPSVTMEELKELPGREWLQLQGRI